MMTGLEALRHLPKLRLFYDSPYYKNIGEQIMISLARKRPLSSSREQIKSVVLEDAIATAVKRSDPSCEAFIGVFVKRSARNSRGEANWDVRGIKFGKAERENCNAALSVIVDRLKREFEISD
jgi:hypothetical protein